MIASIDCTLLTTRNDFNTYARKLLNATGGDLTLLEQCKTEVCSALWGQGNGDISGIGMIVGYCLEHILGFFLTVLVLTAKSNRKLQLGRVPKDCLEAFHLCAIFFAFSIEIAAIVVLVREDFGISTRGMGDFTVRITQTVAMLVLLPLLYPLLGSVKLPWRKENVNLAKYEASSEATKHSSTEFTLFVSTWALAFYPFYSKMNAAFGPTKISSGPNGAINPKQFGVIENICFGQTGPVSKNEDSLSIACVMLTYIPISSYVLGRIIWGGVENNHADSALHKRLLDLRDKIPTEWMNYFAIVAISAIPLLASGLLWSILRVQHLQRAMTMANGGAFQDSSWTFGQIVAVTVFMPVVVECWKSVKTERKSHHPD